MKQYLKLSEIATKYYPQEKGYCTVIALAVVTGWAFGKARSVMYRQQKRVNGVGSTVFRLNDAVKRAGFRVKQVDTLAYGKTLTTAQRDLCRAGGTWLVYTARHVTVIKDGQCEDWSNNDYLPSRYAVESIYKVEEA